MQVYISKISNIYVYARARVFHPKFNICDPINVTKHKY